MDKCLIIADSYTELQRIDAICASRNMTCAVGLRVNPDFSYGPGPCPAMRPGLPDKFGEDEEGLPAHRDFLHRLEHARPTGIHVHARSQVLSADALGRCFEHVARLARVWNHGLGMPLEFIDFGGGLGIPYAGEMRSLNMERLRGHLAGLLRLIPQDGPVPARRYVESGRFLVGDAGVFVTRIVDISAREAKLSSSRRACSIIFCVRPLRACLRPCRLNRHTPDLANPCGAGAVHMFPKPSACPRPLKW